MITGTKEKLDDIAKTYRCPQHDNPLTVAWHAQENSYVIRCGAGHFPEEVTREKSLTQLYKEGVELPEPIKSNVEKSMAKRQAKHTTSPFAVTTTGIPAADLGTGELLTIETVKALVAYAGRYGLDPYRGHVMMMYGKPYIGIDGYLYHAKKAGIPYRMKSRPLTPDERLTYQIPDGAHAWVTEVILEAENRSFIGLGVVTKEEMTEEAKGKPGQLRSPVVAKHPWQLAQKRAEWQALRRAFPIGETEEETIETRDKGSLSG